MSEESTASRPVRATALAVAGGNERAETLRMLRGELGSPHALPLPEFPEVSPGTQPLGATVTHLEALHVDLGPHGWRLTASRAGDSAVTRRVRQAQASLLGVGADVLAGEDAGTTVIRVVGPATLASALALPSGEPLLGDPGALRDVAEAWEEGMARLAQRARASLPGSEIILRLEEPGLQAALDGRVRSSSGYRTLRALDRAWPRQWWEALAQRTPLWAPWHELVGTIPAAAAHAMSLPGEHPSQWEGVAALVEAGRDVVLQLPHATAAPGGAAEADVRQSPATPGARVATGAPETTARRALRLATPWRSIGLPPASLSALTISSGTPAPLGPEALKRQAILGRDLADALDVVRHEDLDGLL